MVIKIIKKRNLPPQRTPAPLVDELPATTPDTKPALQHVPMSSVNAVICSFCNRGYLTPCHGQSQTCQNAQFVRSKLGAA